MVNEDVCRKIQAAILKYDKLLTMERQEKNRGGGSGQGRTLQKREYDSLYQMLRVLVLL